MTETNKVSLNGVKIDPKDLTVTMDAINTVTFNTPGYEVVHAKKGPDTMHIKGNLVIDDGTGEIDLGDFVKTMKERMLILQPNFEAHEKYPALKDLYDQYKMMEKLMVEANNVKDD